MESLENPNPGKDGEKDKVPAKKGRHRSKHKFNSIRSQMEFYFSDANLTKDRYMGQLIRDDPYIQLEEFLKFNKIKALTTSVEEIANAVKNSTLLELSDDRTKVRRKTELVVKENCEECTLYVERLPPKANHDWVRNVFSSYGKVAYVSLPKFKHSRKIKEFGFVEFEEEASVQKALKAFKTFGGVLEFDTVDPAKMASIKTYEQEKNEMPPEPEGASVKAETDGKENSAEAEAGSIKEEEEREGEGSAVLTDAAADPQQEEDTDEPPAKRHKVEPTSDEDDDTQEFDRTDQDEPAAEEEDEHKNATEEEEAKEEGDAQPEVGGKKKCRQRKGCSIIKKELQLDDKVYEIKIMTKKEWRRLRSKYLNLQRLEAKKLKRLFQQTANKQHHKRGGQPKATTHANPTGAGGTSGGGIAIKSIKSSPRVNFYGAMPVDEEHTEVEGANPLQSDQPEESAAAIAKRPLFSFEPGLIVCVKFREPCVDVKDFRAELRQHAYVKYIDLKEGAFEAFVRVDKPGSANALVREYSSAEHAAHILSGEQEQQYWDKMMRDREDKLSKRVKTERVRGRTKLIRKINSHIKLDDDDD
ncbi:la-related protein 7 [Anopheles stephensi]|uniref:la-related protein 7 n=1 Tax=Anopheles stephensi TaxID=30069 RepID=UPI001658A3A5|nr:la-related protein 7 [Anopheles stephensi]